ncbi:ATP-binding protein [Amycolatopsis sp., V23-08]|uniref:ATP-binding protein n=1 Tax=Amycolatopsis heterodermiae TaxID=3110235 RepID=A0ABU5RCE6_9PSEU|nr:ATP-binding protein [Amycolatopsis sp., V23-08]MEA5363309.1 ATP-binding protein [Amycolatopsis sp., V23-08]
MTGEGAAVSLVPVHRPGSTVVTVTGTLDLHSYPDLRDGLLKIATDAPDGVIADIEGLRIRDASLASVFSVIAMRISDWPGIPFSLVSRRPEHLELFESRVIDRFVAVHAGVGEAEAARDCPRRRRAVQLLAPTVGASALAREFVSRVCAQWDVPEYEEDGRLVATELVENTIRHTVSAPRLRLELRRGLFTIAVGDDDPHPAVLHERLNPGEAGIGLRLVAQVARVWGCSRSWSGGKVVWAVLTRRGRPASPHG